MRRESPRTVLAMSRERLPSSYNRTTVLVDHRFQFTERASSSILNKRQRSPEERGKLSFAGSRGLSPHHAPSIQPQSDQDCRLIDLES